MTTYSVPPAAFPTKYWHRLDDGRVQCDVCPRFCKLHEGQRGFCFVRACHDEKIVLTTYGRSSGYCVDPIEKKPLKHFLPGTPVLSFGTAGCNLGCRFCRNWDISKSREVETLCDDALPHTIATAATVLNCPSVAFTYNDPVVFHEYAIDVAQACHAMGVRCVAVTAGEVCAEPRSEFYRHMDAANVDLKAFTERFYQEICASHLQPVLETLLYLQQQTHVWLETTTLLIPGENDSDEELDAMTRWVVNHLGTDVPMHFTAFHPEYRVLDKPPTPPETLSRARRIAMRNGVRYAYTGNVRDVEGASTFCHNCDGLLIGRLGCNITKWNLSHDGTCRCCGCSCAGVFQARPGNWGSRRMPVRLHDYSQVFYEETFVMGLFQRDEYHTHGGRPMGCIVREVQRVERVARPRVVTASVRARRPGQPPETDYGLHETIVHWQIHHFSILRAGMISFIHEEDGSGYRGVFINSIAHDRMMVTRLCLSGTPTHFEVRADENQITWDAQEVNNQESLESLGQLARWEGPMTLVALGTGASFIVGFGPAAAVVGLGAPAATSTLTVSILNSALSNALVAFIHENYGQMFAARNSGQVAHYWQANSSSFGEVLRTMLISGATNAVTGGLFHTPSGTVGFDAFVRHILGRVGNAFASILSTVITERTAPNPRPSERVIRRRITNDLIVNLTFRMMG